MSAECVYVSRGVVYRRWELASSLSLIHSPQVLASCLGLTFGLSFPSQGSPGMGLLGLGIPGLVTLGLVTPYR